MHESVDTIAAIATPTGRGGVAIVRVSGPQVPAIAAALLGGLPPERRAVHRRFLDARGGILDDGVALYFPGPGSFTGEDVLELQGHGGKVVVDMVLRRTLELGARLARPGEFSERAFLNDKLDLAQAEAIADLIDSGSEQAARSAQRSLQGAFSTAIDDLLEKLIELRIYVEAALDFPDEEIDFLADEAVTRRLDTIKAALDTIRARAQQGALLRDGMNLVIVGQPNAGKSTLLNQLAGHEAAIVTEIPGTTRDVLRERISLDGLPLHVIDTAGLRESADPVEQEGIRRAWNEIEQADLILLLLDGTHGPTAEDEAILARLPERLPVLRVHNKIDLTDIAFGAHDGELFISARQGDGVRELVAHLKQLIGYHEASEDVFIARRRHLDALARTEAHVLAGEDHLRITQAGELLAEELRLAQEALGEITGKFTSDDLLGRIFSSFCIGK